MKAMMINEYGVGAPFKAEQLDIPILKSGQVLIKISASSINTVDTMIRKMGKELPFSPDAPAVLGMDFAGRIERVGDMVSGFSEGDEVYGCVGGLGDLHGTLAEYVAADCRLIALKPKNLSMKEAAALPLVGITAYEGLIRAKVTDGQKVLIHGGTGGVGHVALQIAQHLDADVYATVSSDKQMKIIQEYGATPINYKTEEVEDYVNKHTDSVGFDVVFDTVGGLNMLKSFQATALNGHVASTVSLCNIDLSMMHFKGLSLHVIFMLIPMIHNHQRGEHGKILQNISHISEVGNLRPLLDKEDFSLDEVGEAYRRLESGNAIGKVVVEH